VPVCRIDSILFAAWLLGKRSMMEQKVAFVVNARQWCTAVYTGCHAVPCHTWPYE